ncbi:hypothetical protein U9M48_004359, partial [Paspalum notatum var. saurae]
MAAQEKAEEQAPQEQAEEEAPQEEVEEEAPPEDPMGEGDVAGGSSSVRQFRFRSCNSVPKRPAERMLIRPRGEWQWEDVTWDGVGRHSKLRYRLEDEDDIEVLRSVRRHFCRAAEMVIDDAFYNARISAVYQYYKRIKVENMSKKKGASQIYLTEQRYLQVSVDWIVKDMEAWRWLAKKRSTPEWFASSKSHRENRGKAGPRHRFGADGHYILARRMEHESGVPPSFMDVFVRGHRGPDPTNPEVLCTEAAREKMMAYGEKMTQRHGPDFDWRYAFGTGVVDYDQSISRARSSGSSSGSSRSSRTARDTQAEEEARAAREETRQATQTVERLTNMTAYMASYLQDITARLGPDVNLPPFCPPQMSSQQVGATTPGLATTSGVDDGTTGLPATSRVDDGTPGLPDTSGVDGTAGLSASFEVDGSAGLSATSQLDGTARLPASSGMDDTSGLLATFGVDASCCTTLQPMDAINSSELWII